MTSSPHKLIPESFSPVPSHSDAVVTELTSVAAVALDSGSVEAIGVLVSPSGLLPSAIGYDRESLARLGFEAKLGQSTIIPRSGEPDLIAVGAGDEAKQTKASLRDVAGSFARAAAKYSKIAFEFGDTFAAIDASDRARLVAEGILLGRYRYTPLKADPKVISLLSVVIGVGESADLAAAAEGVRRGSITARAANLARDLANTPPSHLTATNFADLLAQIGPAAGLEVEVFDKTALIDLRFGGLLGVNAGSVEEPRLITLRYLPTNADGSPREPNGQLAFVGKGIMYDSGGISLKPSDPMHASMKMDMAGAAAVAAAMTALGDLDVSTAVTAYLVCTDNMPSGSATKLGDVLTIRNGTTVEVKNTDAEGRLVLSDAISLAIEQKPDAIVDIATLTGAALVALGASTAALFANDDELAAQAVSAAATTDESAWRLPLEHKYRDQLNSDVADISNLGGKFAGATTAALFLQEFVDETPWVHLDIAGTMQVDADEAWRPKGATGYGTRLLTELALNFVPTTAADGKAVSA
jgi:leucyl aminopeptidase